MKKQYIETGEISSICGIKGEVKVTPWADSVEFLTGFKKFYDKTGEKIFLVEKSRISKNVVVMKFKNVDTAEQAAKLRGQVIFLERDNIILQPDEFLIQDLIGLKVIDVDSGECYGEINDVSQTGANDVYSIKNDEDDKIRLIPAIKDVIIETNIDKGVMIIRPLKGLFDDED